MDVPFSDFGRSDLMVVGGGGRFRCGDEDTSLGVLIDLYSVDCIKDVISESLSLGFFVGISSVFEIIGLLFSVVRDVGSELRETLVKSGSAVIGIVLIFDCIIFELGSILVVVNLFLSLLRIELDSDAEAIVSLVWSVSSWLLLARLDLDSELTGIVLLVGFAVSWKCESLPLASVFFGVTRRMLLVKADFLESINGRYVE